MTRRYSISVEGYGEAVYEARSAAAAKAKAFRALHDISSCMTFHWFLSRVRVKALGQKPHGGNAR